MHGMVMMDRRCEVCGKGEPHETTMFYIPAKRFKGDRWRTYEVRLCDECIKEAFLSALETVKLRKRLRLIGLNK